MELKLIRHTFLSDRTLGTLYIDGVEFCSTLEDTERGLDQNYPLKDIQTIKQYGITAIPKGVYEVIINYSNRFKRLLPLLLNVPGYVGIRMHNGTKPEHTLGCILMGTRYGNVLINSRDTLEKFMVILTKAVKKEKIKITIQNIG